MTCGPYQPPHQGLPIETPPVLHQGKQGSPQPSGTQPTQGTPAPIETLIPGDAQVNPTSAGAQTGVAATSGPGAHHQEPLLRTQRP